MAIVKPFRALRPTAEMAEEVVSPPYDVVNRKMARDLAEGKPWSFLHICRAEIDLPEDTDPYSKEVYEKAESNIAEFVKEGIFLQEETPVFYIYRQVMNGRAQTGIVACVSVDDYLNNEIKKHELTLAEKEVDRINHFDTCSAHTEPVFLVHREIAALRSMVENWVGTHAPEIDCTGADGTTHELWPLSDPEMLARISGLFAENPLYIADGHHRSASSAKVGLKRREKYPGWTGEEAFNHFMAVILPENDVYICDYSRLIKDLNGYTEEEFFEKMSEHFEVTPVEGRYKPEGKHHFGFCLKGRRWFRVRVKDAINEADPIESLDVSILQRQVLAPILGIEDPRTNQRISFMGGDNNLAGLENAVEEGRSALAIALNPVSMNEIMNVADAGRIMPPKSTWFEPKLGSGLFLHPFEK
ncbi:MAG: DUF1015 domain-containing protein [Clostridiales bacterium]|nr:DUF1015 domain-containing protein [Clostridiales bacterium]